MLRLFTGRYALVLVALACAALFLVSPAYAQTGIVRGTVMDSAGKPIAKALVTIEFKDGLNRKHEVRTNENGEFIQIGLQPGNYAITASDDNLGSQTFPARVRLANPSELSFILGAGSTSSEDASKAAALKNALEEGVAAREAGDHNTAIAKFTEAATQMSSCPDCYYDIGFAHMQTKEYDKAEEAFLKAIEQKPNFAEAYNGLATVYNAMEKFDEAQEAGAKAAELAAAEPTGGGGSTAGVEAEYNQGVIDWNAGRIAEAKEHFQKAILMKPDYAKAHYQLGMALVNEGKIPDAIKTFEKYLELAPSGEFAATAKAILLQIKK